MTIFPRNNLPTDSLNWGREVEKSINNLESGFRTAEVNNVSRDAQLQSSLRRLDTTVTQLATTTATADAANAAAIDALEDAAAAQATATTANSTAISANATAIAANSAAIAANTVATNANSKAIEALEDAAEALQEIVDLSSPGGPTINAANITAGFFSADIISGGTIDASDIFGVTITGTTINGGTITGANILTAASGTRVDLSGSNIEFFSSSYGGGGPRVGYIQGDDGGSPGLYIISDQGAIALDAVEITLAGDATVTGELQVEGSLGVSGSFSPGSISTGAISSSGGLTVSAGGANITGGLQVGQITSTGSSTFTNTTHATVNATTVNGAAVNASTGFYTPGYVDIGTGRMTQNAAGQIEAFGFRATSNINIAGDLFVAMDSGSGTTVVVDANNKFLRSSSSQSYKQQIEEMELSAQVLSMPLKTFKYNYDVETYGEEAPRLYGYIAEELDAEGLTDFVIYQTLEDGTKKPDAVRYDSIFAALHKTVQHQAGVIEALEARLAALEDKVQ